MTPRTRNRIGLVLILLLFAAPLVTAYLLNSAGWRPAGTRNYGTLVEPPLDLAGAMIERADGRPLEWKDDNWSWTLFALPAAQCTAQCLERLDELRRARLTLNQNAYRVRVVVVADVADAALAPLEPVERARDPQHRLDRWRPSTPDALAVVFADPHGYVVLHYPSGYDGNRLRKDLARVIKG